MLKHGGSDIYNVDNLKEDFSVTTNFMGPSSSGISQIIKSVSLINHYPSENKSFFKEGLEFLNVNSQNVLWGNGASELIDLTMRTLVKKFNYKSYAKYNFIQYMEYERACLNNGLVEDLIVNADIVLVINPNNPTGDFYKKDLIKENIKSQKNGSTLIIDESMIFWMGPNWYKHSFVSEKEFILKIKEEKNINIILIHSWTKIFSCTGIRFGSLVSYDNEIICDIEKIKTPWSVNILAYYYLKGCLEDKTYLEETWNQTINLRKYMKDTIQSFFPFCKVNGHDLLSWLWVDFKIDSIADLIYKKSLEHGVPVRHGKVGYNQPTFIRFAVRSKDSCVHLFNMLKEVKNKLVKVPSYYFSIPTDLVYGIIKIPLNLIKSHEEHIIERKNNLLNYLSANDYFVLPSIILDMKNFVVLDGHHRLNILKELGKTEEYVLLVNYNSNHIIPHVSNQITKEEIINAGISGKLVPPKSSKHMFTDLENNLRPLVSLSVIINN
jgi:histidinol-phosphate/aromatic aminotransferase/cobyric acid decarboxylase-like protein